MSSWKNEYSVSEPNTPFNDSVNPNTTVYNTVAAFRELAAESIISRTGLELLVKITMGTTGEVRVTN